MCNVYLTAKDQEDIIDNVLVYFRANVLFRNFQVKGGGDRTLIYLTLFCAMCLVKAGNDTLIINLFRA